MKWQKRATQRGAVAAVILAVHNVHVGVAVAVALASDVRAEGRVDTVVWALAAVVGGDTLPVKKPNAGHLIATIEMAGGDSNLAIMIGDGHNDAKVARAAGVPAVMLSYGYTRIPLVDLKPAVILDEFGEIPEALQALMDTPSY